jgi:hypothetical protein
MNDHVAITSLIQSWGLFRDQGRWDRLAQTFYPEGTISVSWFSGSFNRFIEECKKSYQPTGPRGKHLIGVPYIEWAGDKALAETNVQILGRASIAGSAVDNISHARFLDRISRQDGVWRIVSRVAIYEKDRLDPVVPSEAFNRFMAETDFSAIPESYRYLGYRLQAAGRTLCQGVLCDGTPESLAARAEGMAWLTLR